MSKIDYEQLRKQVEQIRKTNELEKIQSVQTLFEYIDALVEENKDLWQYKQFCYARNPQIFDLNFRSTDEVNFIIINHETNPGNNKNTSATTITTISSEDYINTEKYNDRQ